MTLVPMGEGILATAIAAAVVCAWIAIGSAFLPGPRDDDDDDDGVAAPSAILIGSGITSFLLAAFAAAGFVGSGTAVVGALALVILVVRRVPVLAMVRRALSPYGELARDRVVLLPMGIIATVIWISAISPPRSADAMRYHLAHIRQIVGEGRWAAVADYHYALPFGWSLSYLPFEMSRLPQGAQLLGLCLFVFLFAGVLRNLRAHGVAPAHALAASVLLLHPAVLRAFTEASADAYSLLAIFTITALLIRTQRTGIREAALLGFVSWIGIQSRYQLVAAGIAAAIVIVLRLRGRGDSNRILFAAATGAIAAALLASPFYIANGMRFGNPVWPLAISDAAAHSSYSDFVAFTYSGSLRGTYDPKAIIEAIGTLFSKVFLFPLTIATVVVILAAARSRVASARTLGLFGGIFLVLWIAMQPLLYPRFILLMVPVATLCAGLIVSGWATSPRERGKWILAAARVAIAIAALGSIVLARDSLRFAATGDAQTYHRFTWFYPVYEWVNRSTPRDARFMVIVSSGHSYYLDRPYRRADPWISGVVDWPATGTGKALDALMEQGGYSYMIYEDRDWSVYPGGKAMHRAVSEAIATGTLTPIRSFDERLYISRIRRVFRTTRVYLLERTPARAAGG